MENSPLPLFANAQVLEISAPFADLWYPEFWEDLGNVGAQLITLRLEVIEGMRPAAAESVEELVRTRFHKGMPLRKLERMMFEGADKEDEEKAKMLWEEFRAGLDIDQYVVDTIPPNGDHQ